MLTICIDVVAALADNWAYTYVSKAYIAWIIGFVARLLWIAIDVSPFIYAYAYSISCSELYIIGAACLIQLISKTTMTLRHNYEMWSEKRKIREAIGGECYTIV